MVAPRRRPEANPRNERPHGPFTAPRGRPDANSNGARRRTPFTAARARSGARLALIVAAALALCSAAAQPLDEAHAALAAGLLEHSNAARRSHGLGTLVADPLLAAAATAHAHEMAALGYFDHASPVPANATLGRRVANAGSPLVEVGENLARLSGVAPALVPERVVQGWLDSPGHRRNLLGSDYNRVGFGLYEDPALGLLVVQVLGWEPFALSSSAIEAATRTSTDMVLRFDSRTAVEVVLSFGGGSGAPIQLPAGISDVVLVPVAVDTELAVGVRQGGRFLVDEAVTLRAAPILGSATTPAGVSATFAPAADAPRRYTRLVDAFSTVRTTSVVRVDLDYRDAPRGAVLVLFGERSWAEAEVSPGRFELALDAAAVAHAARDGEAEVLVGLSLGGGRVRVFHRFDLASFD